MGMTKTPMGPPFEQNIQSQLGFHIQRLRCQAKHSSLQREDSGYGSVPGVLYADQYSQMGLYENWTLLLKQEYQSVPHFPTPKHPILSRSSHKIERVNVDDIHISQDSSGKSPVV